MAAGSAVLEFIALGTEVVFPIFIVLPPNYECQYRPNQMCPNTA